MAMPQWVCTPIASATSISISIRIPVVILLLPDVASIGIIIVGAVVAEIAAPSATARPGAASASPSAWHSNQPLS